MINRAFRFIVIAWFTVVSVLAPVRSYAVVPIIGMAAAAMTGGGTVSLSAGVTSAVTALIGGTIMAIAISPSQLSDGAPVIGTRIATTTDPAKTSAAMPAPPAAASAPVGYSATAQEQALYMQMCEQVGNTWSCGASVTFAQCMTWLSYGARSYGVSCAGSNSAGGRSGNYYALGAAGGGALPSGTGINNVAPFSCGSGYSMSGSSCALVDARAAVSDKQADYVRSDSGWSSSDIDKSDNYLTSSNGKTFFASGTNSSGSPVVVSVSATPSGGTQLDVYTQGASGGASTVQKTSLTLDSSGVVTAANSSVNSGSISNAGTASAAVNTQSGTSTSSVSASGVTAGTSTVADTGSNILNFPSDYARTGEAANAANTIKTSLETDAPVPSLPDQELSAFDDSFFKETFKPLLSWSLPAHSSVCPTAVFDYSLFGYRNHLVMDAQCTIAENVRPTLSVVMVAFWIIAALFIVMAA